MTLDKHKATLQELKFIKEEKKELETNLNRIIDCLKGDNQTLYDKNVKL
jgi:hypothetical protein